MKTIALVTNMDMNEKEKENHLGQTAGWNDDSFPHGGITTSSITK